MADKLIFESDFLRDSKFNGVIIDESEISEKEFYNCTFENCNFSKVKFAQCRFEDCDFNNCDFSVAKVNESEFIDVRFFESKLLGIDWTVAKSPLRIELRKCKINHSTFFGMNLKNLVIENCIANEVDFTDAILSRTNCSMTDFHNSKFQNTDLSYADFTKAKNYDINPNYNNIKKAIFSIPEAITLLQGFDIVIK